MRSRIGSFFRNLLRKGAVEQALDDELQSAVELLTQEKMKEGLSHPAARRQALIAFGGVEQVKEQVRASRTGAFLDSLLQDLRFALRQMQRSPGFALSAVLILALGIAANVIVFGVLQAMVLRSLDLPHADRVMTLGSTGMAFPVLAYPEVRDVRDDSTVFSAVAADVVQNFGLEAN